MIALPILIPNSAITDALLQSKTFHNSLKIGKVLEFAFFQILNRTKLSKTQAAQRTQVGHMVLHSPHISNILYFQCSESLSMIYYQPTVISFCWDLVEHPFLGMKV